MFLLRYLGAIRFTQYVPLKIQYGNTRKQIFLQEKWMKFLSTGISGMTLSVLLACGESLDGVRIIGTIGSLLLHRRYVNLFLLFI